VCCQRPDAVYELPSISSAANEDIQHFYVRNIGMPNIIGVLAALMSHGG
jgi:hypothetical protein